MVNSVVFDYLKFLAKNPEIKESLKTKSKDEVLQFANDNGYIFETVDFDDTIWGYEETLSKRMKEDFNLSFSLWETMWGRFYLDYLVDNLAATIDYDSKN